MTPERFARLKQVLLAAKALPERERDVYLDQACADNPTLRPEVESLLVQEVKPSNVLIVRQDGRPVPKVIDFGIAKAMADPAGERTLFTEAGIVVGTPAYMSPEQAGALPGGVDTRSDVYSLGVMLYELLTGRRPYRFPEGSPAEVLRTLAEAPPLVPSAAVTRPAVDEGRTADEIAATRGSSPDRLRRELTGDLDNIVLKALQKDRERRYASVEQLAEDVRRHLEGRPVLARPATWSYRAGRFARRHRAGVAMASAFAALGIAFVISMAVQSARVARERDRAPAAEQRARLEAATAQRVSDFLVGLFQVSDPSEARGSTVTAREILDKAAARIAAELGEEPALRATMMHTIAGVYLSLGLVSEARPLAEEALRLRRDLHGEAHPEVAEALVGLARLRSKLGDYAWAGQAFGEATAIYDKSFGEGHPLAIAALSDRGAALLANGQLPEAEADLREASALARGLDSDPEGRLPVVLTRLGNLLVDKSQYAAAEPLLREAVEAGSRLWGEDHPSVASAMSGLAMALLNKGAYAEAEPLMRRSLELQRKLLGADHPDLAHVLNELSAILKEAERLFREAVAMRRRLYPPGNPQIGHNLVVLGRLLLAQKRWAEAEEAVTEMLRIRRATMPADDWRLDVARSMLGATQDGLGKRLEAKPLLEESYEALRSKKGENHPETVFALRRLVLHYDGAGDASRAAEYRSRLPPGKR